MRSATRTRRQLRGWQEAILLIAVALVMAVVVKTFLVQAFYIPSGSMEPTMMENDKLLVQKVSYWKGDVSRGDVIVFKDPDGWLPPESTTALQRGLAHVGLVPAGGHLIKRVIGVGGDHVVCCNAAGKLTVNGTALDEPYLKDETVTKDKPFDITVPADHLWVMGDNRGNSEDSRYHVDEATKGFVPTDDVVGKAWVRVWPWDRIGVIRDQPTFDGVSAP